MPVDSAEFRRVLGHWPSGVAIVTTRMPDGRPCGLTANAVSSLSLDPPLVLACIERVSDTHDCILAQRSFAINVLSQDGERIARRFASVEPGVKFEGVAWHAGATSAPLLDDALAWVDCELHAHHDGGDHSIFVGRVVEGDAHEGAPLLYYRSGYGRFTP
jgi:flavin reductase (DIM6/NTAB) family NADH-FMN oxidoreductase RutF